MEPQTAGLMRKTWLRQTLSLLIFFALLFAPAGTLRFWQGWLFGLIFLGASTGLGVYFLKHDPALLERRMNAGPGAEQEPTQKVIITAIIIGFCLLIGLPSLDHRWHWSEVPTWLVLLANAGAALRA